jgi:hypothetical protein
MKKTAALIAGLCFAALGLSQNSTNKTHTMKLNAGIVTAKIAETKAFYTGVLGFGVTFENEFYLLLHTPAALISQTFFW